MIVMKRLGLMAFFLIGLISTGWAEGVPLPEGLKVRAIVADVVAHYKTHGAQSTFDKLNAGWTLDGEYYAFAIDVNKGIIIAHASNADMVGVSVSDVNSEGRYVIQEIIDAATGMGAWLEYHWNNPETGVNEGKRSWLLRIDNYVFGSGYYL